MVMIWKLKITQTVGRKGYKENAQLSITDG